MNPDEIKKTFASLVSEASSSEDETRSGKLSTTTTSNVTRLNASTMGSRPSLISSDTTDSDPLATRITSIPQISETDRSDTTSILRRDPEAMGSNLRSTVLKSGVPLRRPNAPTQTSETQTPPNLRGSVLKPESLLSPNQNLTGSMKKPVPPVSRNIPDVRETNRPEGRSSSEDLESISSRSKSRTLASARSAQSTGKSDAEVHSETSRTAMKSKTSATKSSTISDVGTKTGGDIPKVGSVKIQPKSESDLLRKESPIRTSIVFTSPEATQSIMTTSRAKLSDVTEHTDKSRTPSRTTTVASARGSKIEVPITSVGTDRGVSSMPESGVPGISTSQREVRTFPPSQRAIIQDVSLPPNTGRLIISSAKQDRLGSRTDPRILSPNIDTSREGSSTSRTISLDRVSSRMDVRISTQPEKATSQGDVTTSRVEDIDRFSSRTADTRSFAQTETSSRGDTSIPQPLVTDRPLGRSESRGTTQPDITTLLVSPTRSGDPEKAGIQSKRSILRRSDSQPQNEAVPSSSRRFSFPTGDRTSATSTTAQELQTERVAHRGSVLPTDPDQSSERSALKRTYSRITFPSFSSAEESTTTGTHDYPSKKRTRSQRSVRDSVSHLSTRTSQVSSATTSRFSEGASTDYTYVEDLDEAHQRLGERTWITWRILMAACAPGFVNMWLLASTVLLTSNVHFRCRINTLDDAKWSSVYQRELIGVKPQEDVCYIPLIDYSAISRMNYDEAVARARREIFTSKRTHCKDFIFESGNTTLIAEFRLICERKPLLLVFLIMAGIGMSLGAVVFGCMCDHFGRRPVFIVSLVMYTLCFPMSVIIPDYWAITISHFLCGIANSGCFISAIVIMLEWSKVSNRPMVGVVMFLPWGIGLVFIAIVAFYVSEWWYLQITISVPAAALLVCAFVLPESPRWLNAVGKKAKAWKVIRKFCKHIRPLEMPEDIPPPTFEQRMHITTKYWGYLTTKRELRWRLIICMLASYGAGTVYYLVVLRAGAYGEVVYFLLALCGVLEMVACGISIVLLSMFGPRPTSSILFLICGAAISFSTFVPNTMISVVLFLLVFARMIACILYFTIIIQTIELFPTLVRGTALGIVLMFTYAFGFVVPLIVVGSSRDLNQNAIRNAYCVFAVVCGVIVLLLPCTRRRFLTDTIEDVTLEASRGFEVSCKNLYTRE